MAVRTFASGVDEGPFDTPGPRGEGRPAADRAPAAVPRAGRRRSPRLAVALALALVAAGCGGTKGGSDAGGGPGDGGLASRHLGGKVPVESGLATAGTPKRGGTLTYGLEGETDGGFCLPEGQLAISGMMVVRAVYDTLTVPDAAGDYVPYLAKSITHNADDTVWTIGLRSGIRFSDGSPLTATVVKNNLDAYRGKYPGRSALLFAFLLHDIESVSVVDPLTVQVRTAVPWAAFPAQLYASSRMGIMGQAQLDDKTSCATHLVGTGPFTFRSWTRNAKLVAVRNPHYWQVAPDGKPYPYADEIVFRPLPDSGILMDGIKSGDLNIVHTADPKLMGGTLADLRDAHKANLLVSTTNAEVTFIQLNNTKPPFDDVRMRRALAMATDRAAANQFQNDGYADLVEGPIPPGRVGYVAHPGFPAYDPAGARKLVRAYVRSGGRASFTFTAGTDDDSVSRAEELQQMWAKVGIEVRIIRMDQASAINAAIGHTYQAAFFRNFPGGDPDELKVWFAGELRGSTTKNPVNLAGFDDPVVNAALDAGRRERDPAERAADYEKLVRRMASQVFDLWLWNAPWAVATASNVHGILGPPLPGADPSQPGPRTTTDPTRQPSTELATGHSLLGLWVG